MQHQQGHPCDDQIDPDDNADQGGGAEGAQGGSSDGLRPWHSEHLP